MNKTISILIITIGMLMMTACSKNSEMSSDEQTEAISTIPTQTPEVTKAVTVTVAPTKAPVIDSVADKKEEQELFNSILASIPLKAEVPITYDFDNVSVHDPSIVENDGTYYVFGSHLAVAKTTDLMNWSMVASGVSKNNKVIPDAMKEMSEAFTWARTNTFWAPDVIQLEDGRFYYYYCNCEGSSPLSALGVAVSDQIEGPYQDLGLLLKSGMGADIPGEDGDVYDATVDPNVVDPCVFYDKEGKLWMMYGSYSGGIFILELDQSTGFPKGKGYGKKLLGKNHLRIEGSFIQYSEETGYYYMFLSFGGLDARGAYNIRVCRSENPDGPYYDAQGNDMINCQGADGSFFDDNAMKAYGTKLMGNFKWESVVGEDDNNAPGYVSPGHNSTLYEEETGKYFLVFHTRFEGRGETHEVRVHQMFLNDNGWFVAAPYRYTGETIGAYTEDQIAGIYKVINHQLDVSAKAKESENVILKEDHTVAGDWHGTWELAGDNSCTLTIDGVEYNGVFLKQWDESGLKNVMTFTVQSLEGRSIWGSGYKAME